MGIIGGVLFLAATGAIAIPVAITGLPFNITGTALHGQNFSQYGSIDACQAGALSTAFCTSDHVGVAITTIGTLDDGSGNGIVGLDQVVCGPTGIPISGLAYLKLEITGDSVKATNLVADVTALTTDSGVTTSFNNLTVGIPLGPSGSLGQTADSFDIGGNFKQTAVATTAGTFQVKHLGLHVTTGPSC